MRDTRTSGSGRRPWHVGASRVPALALVIAVSVTAFASVAAAAPTDRMSKMVGLLGLDTFFAQMGPAVKMGIRPPADLARDPASPGAAYWEKVMAGVAPAADLAFSPEALQREFLLAMAGKLDEADLDAIFAFYTSPLGTRMTALENAENARQAAEPDATERSRELIEELEGQRERVEMLTRLERSLRLTETITDLSLNVTRAIAIGMAAADEKTTTLTAEAIQAIDAVLEKTRPARTARVRDEVLLSLASTYRDASISELRQYLAFLATPAGKKLYAAAQPAIADALVKAGARFGHALMKELGKERA